ISIAYFTQLALLAVISSHARLLQAAPFPAIENAAFTSYDLQAEESAPALSQVHAQHNRHRRHDGDGNNHGHSHHRRHWDHHFPGPDCHHPGGFGFEHPPYHRPPHHRFESLPHGFESFPNFEPPEYEEHQRPFKAQLEPFKDEKKSGPKPPSTTSVAPPPAPFSIPETSTNTGASTTTSTTAATTTAPTSSSSSTEDATLAIDIRIG
ncbi:hypothetical protein KR067_004620, partial [Drosophila pandora]